MREAITVLFEKYQIFLVGTLGFAGVMLTILTNARLSLKQHEHQIKHEKMSVRTAICTELELICNILNDRCKVDNTEGELQSGFFPDHIPNQVYLNFINKLGLLSVHEIKAVIEAHALLNDIPTRLRLLSKDYDPSFDKKGYIYIDSKHVKTAIGVHECFLPKIKHTIKILKDNIKVERVNKPP